MFEQGETINNRAVWVTLGAIIAIKVFFLALYGPIYQPDSTGYQEFTDLILGLVPEQAAWLTEADLHTNYWFDQSAFRIIGYPAIIALAKTLTPTYWAWLIVAGQVALSLVATIYVLRLAQALSDRRWVALVAAFAHGTGQGLVLDQAILTDSFNASLLIIVAAHMGIGLVQRRAPTLQEAFGLGVLMMLSFLLREAANVLQYLYWPLLLAWFAFTRKGEKEKGAGALRAVALVVAFAAPLFLCAEAYKSWNQTRTGERFITTAGQTGMFVPLYKLHKRGIDPFINDEPLKHMKPLAEMNNLTPYQTSALVNAYLNKTHDYSALDIARKGYRVYFANWAAHPIDMVAVTLSSLKLKLTFLAFMPVEAGLQTALWSEGTSPLPRTKRQLWTNLVEDGRVDQALIYLGRGLSRIVSVIIMVAFVIALPWRMLGELRAHRLAVFAYSPRTALMFVYWLVFFGYTFAYAMVSMEGRYLMPVLPLAMVCGLTLLAPLVERAGGRVSKLVGRGGA